MFLQTTVLAILSTVSTTIARPPEKPFNLGQSICTDNHCGHTSYEEILKRYNGTLLSWAEFEDLNARRITSRNDYMLKNHGFTQETINKAVGDGDSCCATSITYKLNYTLTNIYGHEKSIVHMPDAIPARYQFIPHAQCVSKQECDGSCLIEPVLLTLLILEGDELKFDYFLIPGYCSCKNVNL